MTKKLLKLYIVRKYVQATSVQDAIKKEKEALIDDCWLDDDWKKNNLTSLTDRIGF